MPRWFVKHRETVVREIPKLVSNLNCWFTFMVDSLLARAGRMETASRPTLPSGRNTRSRRL